MSIVSIARLADMDFLEADSSEDRVLRAIKASGQVYLCGFRVVLIDTSREQVLAQNFHCQTVIYVMQSRAKIEKLGRRGRRRDARDERRDEYLSDEISR